MTARGEQLAVADIVSLAVRISRAAPRKQGQYVSKAGVPWTLIHELRAALDALTDAQEGTS
jgi:hypothetical protein